MNKNISKIIRVAVGLASVGLIISCGESTNLADPSTAVSTQCTDENGLCVAGRFIDDAVYNLDYECGKVKGKTGLDGSFSCPLGSQVTFLIKNPKDVSSAPKQIVLGEIAVQKPAFLGATIKTFFYVTPQKLFTDRVQKLNMVRLLQALSDNPDSADSPAYIIFLSDMNKEKLASLAASLKPEDFKLPISTSADPAPPSAGSFDELVKPLLDAFTPAKTLISESKASEYLQRGINSSYAGVYTSPAGILASVVLNRDTGGMTGSNTADNKNFIATLWSVVDRKGRVMGGGVYSYEAAATLNHLLTTNPKPMELQALGTPGVAQTPAWPNSANLSGLAFSLRDENKAAIDAELMITQGVIDREAIAGTDTPGPNGARSIYRNLFDEMDAPLGRLGRWKLKESAGQTIAPDDTVYSLVRSAPAAPALDPDLWRVIAPSLPLNLALTFYNSDVAPPCDTTNGCTMDVIKVSILADGNIVSDLNGDCNAGIDKDTLVDAASQQELPLGLVQNIFQSRPNDLPKNATFMTLALIVPNRTPYDTNAYLPYAQFLTNFGVGVMLRVDDGSIADQYQLHSSSTNADGTTYTAQTAGWTNYFAFLRAIYAADPDRNPNTEDALPEAAGLEKNSGGYVHSALVTGPGC